MTNYGRYDAFRAMHRRAQAAESLANKWRVGCAVWIAKAAKMTAHTHRERMRLESLVVDLAESLAEAGVAPLTGSDNPHEDTLGQACDLLIGARLAVAKVIEKMDAEPPAGFPGSDRPQ